MKKPDAAAKVVVAEHRAGETIQKTTLASKISTVSSGGYLILRGLWWRIADVPALLMLPWNLAHDREQFHGLPPITAAFIVGFPLFMLVGVTRLKTRVPLALAAGYTLLWFTMARDTRYLLPVLPLYGLAIGESLDRLLLALPLSPRITRHWIIAVAGFIAFSYTGWRYSSATARTLGVIPTDAEERDVFINDHVAQSAPLNVTDLDSSLRPAYLSRHFAKHQSSYPAYQLLNKRKGSNYTLYGLYDENMAYFAQGKFIGDWTGPARYANLQHNLTDGKTLYQFLKGYNVTHFLVGMHRVPLLLPQDDFFRDHFRPIYDREVALYELIDEQDIHRVERELLKNGGFEQMGADGKPVGWQASGSPAIDSTAEHVRAGQGAMSARGSQNAFLQTVGVKPLTAYRYRFQARAEREDQAVRMQLHWSDAKGELLHYDIRALKAGTQWKTYDVTTVAPEGAAYVTIFASPHGDSTIWFDEVSFAEVQYETATTQASR
jgi:hypothetical protein